MYLAKTTNYINSLCRIMFLFKQRYRGVWEMIIRYAEPKDKDFVIEFTRHTWEHGDYIEDVWDAWVNDTLGKLFVAEIDKKPVGIMHVTFLTPDYAWLEGARVHPDYRGRGIATELNKACMNWAKEHGAKKIGLLTAETNYPAHRASEKVGMKMVSQWIFARIDLDNFTADKELSLDDVEIAKSTEFMRIMNYLTHSEGYKKVGGYFSWHFEVLPLDKRFIIQELGNKRVFVARDTNTEEINAIGFQEFYLDWETNGLSLYFGYLDGTPDGMYKIVHKVYSMFKENNIKKYRLCMPSTDNVVKLIDRLPLSREPGRLRVYEKTL